MLETPQSLSGITEGGLRGRGRACAARSRTSIPDVEHLQGMCLFTPAMGPPIQKRSSVSSPCLGQFMRALTGYTPRPQSLDLRPPSLSGAAWFHSHGPTPSPRVVPPVPHSQPAPSGRAGCLSVSVLEVCERNQIMSFMKQLLNCRIIIFSIYSASIY